jgi:transposase
MPTERIAGKPSTRRYTPAEREQAVRLVRQLRSELGTEQGTVARVAKQLGYGVESVRAWVNQSDVDGGLKDGTSTEDARRIKDLEQEVKELRRANEILRKASAYFAQAELDRPPR